ncbi:DUF6569 family protein [Prosthecobacter sp.]|uniref:ARPP-1 family domain-containing protein n=1 Tax=Prosthecobacter sp. TaxID=1965333 RepID=UPI001DCCD864|nr:DUF6569 family protein [Prosthecobacter sp.]MCB1275376.1 hypothetical protein [Prosthecobacter sp.]
MKKLILFTFVAAAAAFYTLSAQDRTVNRRPSNSRQMQQSVRTNAVKADVGKPATLKKIASGLKVAVPVKHANLEVFLIEGDDLAGTKNVLTLDEAMSASKPVVVKETSQVNELTVNNSQDEKEVFIMAGDIVKGGRQDRTLGSDLPLKPKSGEVSVASFCVEQGRWSKRGNESAAQFSSSKNVVASKEGKLAVRKAGNQGEVWQSVAAAQEKISRNIGKDVKPTASATSLQLTLEDKDLKSKIKTFVEALKPAVESSPRSLGFVCAINGEINSAEIFAGHDLFRRVWPKMLEGLATEAISLADGKPAADPATNETAVQFINRAESAAATEKPLQGSLKHVSAESEDTVLFETVDEKKEGRWLRRNIIKK